MVPSIRAYKWGEIDQKFLTSSLSRSMMQNVPYFLSLAICKTYVKHVRSATGEMREVRVIVVVLWGLVQYVYVYATDRTMIKT